MFMSGKTLEYTSGRTQRISRLPAIVLSIATVIFTNRVPAEEPVLFGSSLSININPAQWRTPLNKKGKSIDQRVVDTAIDRLATPYCYRGGTEPKNNNNCLNCLGLIYGALEDGAGIKSKRLSRNGTEMIPQLLGRRASYYQFKSEKSPGELFLVRLENRRGEIIETFIPDAKETDFSNSLKAGDVLFLTSSTGNIDQNTGRAKENPVAVFQTALGTFREWIWHTGITSDQKGNFIHASYVGNPGYVQQENLREFLKAQGYSGAIVVRPKVYDR